MPSENMNSYVNILAVYLNKILNHETKRIQSSFPPSISQTLPLITHRGQRLNTEDCISRRILLHNHGFIIKAGQGTTPLLIPHTGFLQTSSILQCSIKERKNARSPCGPFQLGTHTPHPTLSFPGTRITGKHRHAQRWFGPTEPCIGPSSLV